MNDRKKQQATEAYKSHEVKQSHFFARCYDISINHMGNYIQHKNGTDSQPEPGLFHFDLVALVRRVAIPIFYSSYHFCLNSLA
ncbi:MAG TPA: hypothetical protein PLR90_09495 [Methylophilus sp.]|nr:hypothetical protein [Methylophilus sp.]